MGRQPSRRRADHRRPFRRRLPPAGMDAVPDGPSPRRGLQVHPHRLGRLHERDATRLEPHGQPLVGRPARVPLRVLAGILHLHLRRARRQDDGLRHRAARPPRHPEGCPQREPPLPDCTRAYHRVDDSREPPATHLPLLVGRRILHIVRGSLPLPHVRHPREARRARRRGPRLRACTCLLPAYTALPVHDHAVGPRRRRPHQLRARRQLVIAPGRTRADAPAGIYRRGRIRSRFPERRPEGQLVRKRLHERIPQDGRSG